MRLSELMQGLPVLWAQGDAEISGICVDSRTVQPGDLFVAIVGRTHDGHKFIADAIARGAAAVMTQHRYEGVPAIYTVPNTRDALWRIAQRFYGDPSRQMLTIGVTGTNGKTTTSHMLQKILVAWGKPTLIVGTLGAWIDYPDGSRHTLAREGEFTTPEVYQLQSLLKTAHEQGAQAVVMEVSSHALDQQRADGIHFDAAVFTNLTQDHPTTTARWKPTPKPNCACSPTSPSRARSRSRRSSTSTTSGAGDLQRRREARSTPMDSPSVRRFGQRAWSMD